MELKFVHEFPELTVDEFEDMLATQDFNRIFENLPNVRKRTLLEEKDLGGGKRRTVVKFEAKAPEAMKKLLGEDFGWTEQMDFDRNTHLHRIKNTPTKLQDRLTAEGTYKLEPMPNGGTRRTVIINLKIKILGVGAIAERSAKPFLEAGSREEEKLAREYIRNNLDKLKKRKK